MSVRKGVEKMYYFPRPNRWTKGIGAELPEAYKKFWKEWKMQKPTPVHYIEKQGKYEKNRHGLVQPVQNNPLPVKFPKESNEGIWGGEGIIQGFKKKDVYARRVPHFWFPILKRSVVYSEVLDKYMSVVITERTVRLIHENYGFDHYLLKTPACDLVSQLALKIKRDILVALADKTLYPDDPVKREEIYEKYKEYLTPFTREEIEWYGLSYKEACQKHKELKAEQNKPQPMKLQLRQEYLQFLKEQEKLEIDKLGLAQESPSWMSKLNPFGKKKEA